MADNEILKKTLKHYIDLEYYANGLDAEFQTLLSELTERCRAAIEARATLGTKAGYNAVYRIIKEEVGEFQKELEERLEEEAERIMSLELGFLDDTYNEPTENKGSSAAGALALGGVALSKLLFAPIDGRDTLGQFAERTGKNILRTYDTALRAGYIFGQDTKDTSGQIANNLKQVARGMQSGIRTAVPSFAKTTDRIVFLNNDVEVVWVATLDGRTCIRCSALSGLHFKSISVAPSIQHCGCRCQLIPVNKVTEPIPTYEEFIESLDEEDQISILGKNRYDLWKNYGISLERFVNNGEIVPLAELEESLGIAETKTVQTASEKTAELVKKNYPNDTFVRRKITDNASLYVAKNRIKAGVKDPLVYNSDKTMAETLAKETNIDFYLITEKGDAGIKHPDGFFMDATMEMKHVRGGIDKVGINAVKALDQAPNIFIYTDKPFAEDYCLSKIRGSLKARRDSHSKNGTKFTEPIPNGLLYIYTDGKLYKHTWADVL